MFRIPARSCGLVVATLCTLAACSPSPHPHTAPGDTFAPPTIADGGSGDELPDAGALSPECTTLAQRIWDEHGQEGQMVVARFDYETLQPIGFTVREGWPLNDTDEEDARAAAQSDTGFGATGLMLNPPAPDDFYVFYEEPGDFGGVAVTDASGAPAFGGGIVWLGRGDITSPLSWSSAEGLQPVCPLRAGRRITAWDLRRAVPLESAELKRIKDAFFRSPVAHAFRGDIEDALFLLYPRTLGAFDPSTAEFIVVYETMWLL